MCGISVIISKNLIDIYKKLLLSLYQIKHRGYDSIGLLLINNKNIKLYKEISIKNKLVFHKLNKYNNKDLYNIGFGHNRYANYGNINIENTHPITLNNKIFVCHNGTITNFKYLNKLYFNDKYDNDTHIIVGLITLYYEKYHNMEISIKYTIHLLKGTYGLIIYNINNCNKIYIIKKDIPLLIGYNNDCIYITSEIYGFCNEINYYSSFDDNKLYIINNYKLNDELLKFKPFISKKIIYINYENYTKKEILKTSTYIDTLINNNNFTINNKKYFDGNINLFYNTKIETFKYYFNYLFNKKKTSNEYFNIYFTYFSDNNKIYEKLKYYNNHNKYISIISNKHSHIGRISKNIILCDIGREKTILSIKPEISNIIIITLLYINVYNDYQHLYDLLNLSDCIKNIYQTIINIPIHLNNKLSIKYDNTLNKMICQHIKLKYKNIILIDENYENYDIHMSNNFIKIQNNEIKLMNSHFNFLINFYIIHYYIYKYMILNNINPDIPIY